MANVKKPVFIRESLYDTIHQAYDNVRDDSSIIIPTLSQFYSWLLEKGMVQVVREPVENLPEPRKRGRPKMDDEPLEKLLRDDPYLSRDLINRMQAFHDERYNEVRFSYFIEIMLWNGLKYLRLNRHVRELEF